MPGEPDIEIGYRLLIPVVHVGALIGRGGEAIAQLRQRTGARVKVHDAHDSEQHLHLQLHPNSSTRIVSFVSALLLSRWLASPHACLLLVVGAAEHAAPAFCTADTCTFACLHAADCTLSVLLYTCKQKTC